MSATLELALELETELTEEDTIELELATEETTELELELVGIGLSDLDFESPPHAVSAKDMAVHNASCFI